MCTDPVLGQQKAGRVGHVIDEDSFHDTKTTEDSSRSEDISTLSDHFHQLQEKVRCLESQLKKLELSASDKSKGSGGTSSGNIAKEKKIYAKNDKERRGSWDFGIGRRMTRNRSKTRATSHDDDDESSNSGNMKD
jgi:hypothetical protein